MGMDIKQDFHIIPLKVSQSGPRRNALADRFRLPIIAFFRRGEFCLEFSSRCGAVAILVRSNRPLGSVEPPDCSDMVANHEGFNGLAFPAALLYCCAPRPH